MSKKIIILLGTLKSQGISNTETLCLFFKGKCQEKGMECEIIKLVDHNILPGTFSDMGSGDEWPVIQKKIVESDVIVFATPIWWGNQSSEIQRVIERLDVVHDEILDGKQSRLEGKVGGVIITGDSDGAQNVIANTFNFFNAIGIAVPPYASLSVLWEGQKKGAQTTEEELMKKYESEYSQTADKMIDGFLKH